MSVKRLYGGIFVVVAALCVIAVAQAQSGPTRLITRALSQTLQDKLAAAGFPSGSPINTATVNAVSAALDAATTAGGGSTSSLTWLYALANLIPNGDPFGTGGGGFDGGGATGSWDDGSCPLDMRFDVGGNLIIPAMPLTPGDAMKRGDSAATATRVNDYIVAKTEPAAALYQIHLKNLDYGSTKKYWVAPFRLRTSTGWYDYDTSRVASYDGSTLISNILGTTSVSRGYKISNENTSQQKGCPVDMTGASGDFDFYFYPVTFNQWTTPQGSQNITSCVWYAPNRGLSPSGYAYPTETVWPKNYFNDFPTGNDALKGCQIHKKLLARLLEKAWCKAQATGGYAGAPCQTVSENDVKLPEAVPTMQDIGKERGPLDGTNDPSPTATPSAQPTPEPTPTSTPSAGPTYDPTVTNPDLVAPEIDWWPDLPTISVDLGGATCPTYQLDLTDFGGAAWNYTVDQHCPLIEQNAAAIGAIMLLLWGVGAVLIVLKA